MVINLSYKEILIGAIKDAPDECFDYHPTVIRKKILDDDENLDTAVIVFQSLFENGCSLEEAKLMALDRVGLRNLERINEFSNKNKSKLRKEEKNMLIDPGYEQELIAAIKDAPEDCFEEPASVTRAAFLDNARTIADAVICFQADFEEYDSTYDEALKAALEQVGLKHLELIFGDEKNADSTSVNSSRKYVAVIAPEYVRNVEVFDSYYDKEEIDDYIYDDLRWQEAPNAEVFIGVFQTADCNDEAMQKIKEDAVSTAINNGLCEELSFDAVKLIEV